MKYKILLVQSPEGWAAGCPAIPGCWTQGNTREEALENIGIAIREVLEVREELAASEWRAEGCRVETAEVELANA
ncbi:MAG TPA: type II toxin-antitoxin system HicB family antitoxin [Verrucomicrobiales bacterium]|jgi:predicted RNase H-like HicB family nuclease|nr:type II toxin-antitoxin system HicB family antitoxin [Verrucomicrobiales bacterium]